MPKDCISSTGWAVRALAVTLAGLALSGIAPPITWAAEADAKGPGEDVGAAEAFESLYGQDVERVRGTSEPADDIALAKRLLSAARDTTGTPALLRVLCNEAYSLAAAYPDGYPTAVEAAACLASHVPSSAVDAADRIVAVRQKQYARAEGDAKAAAGATLVEALVRLADAHVEAMTYPQAIAALKRAARVSRSVGGDRLRAIEARRERARFLLRTRRDIANMKDLIEREPANTSAREKLVRLYLVHLDDPAAAAKHLDGVEDEDLLKYVRRSARALNRPRNLRAWSWAIGTGAWASPRRRPPNGPCSNGRRRTTSGSSRCTRRRT